MIFILYFFLFPWDIEDIHAHFANIP